MNALSNSLVSAALCVAAVALLFFWRTADAQAGQGGASGPPAFCHFTVSGEIGDTTLAYVRNQLNSSPKAAQNCIVSFASLGGDVESAIEVGRFLRARHATTLVPANATCASACVLAFLGGVQRLAPGRIGIHRPYSSDLSSSVGQSEHSYSQVNGLVKSYFSDMNVPVELLTAMNGIPPDQVMWLSANEATRFHITGDDPAWADYQDSRTAKALGISKEALYERRTLAKRLCASERDPVQQYICTSKIIHDGAPQMISRELHIAIEKWIKADTWHTSHPSDDDRFYALLAVVEFEGAHNFDVDGFIDVASELAIRYHPKMKHEFISDNINDKALQAEAVMGYIAFRQRH